MYTGACGAAPAGAAVVPSGVVAVGLGGDGWSAVEVGGGAGRRGAAAAFAAAARSTAKFLLPTSQFYLPSSTGRAVLEYLDERTFNKTHPVYREQAYVYSQF